MRNGRKFIALLLGVVFLQYFASTTFFVHCHKLATRTIVHSHPFPNKANNHTEDQVLCLDLLSQATCVSTPQISAPDFTVNTICTVGCEWVIANGQVSVIGIRQLRAPPVC